ncbi:uncharacterized protein A4U43_C07F28150 [Asparagus officinalis]|uniref:F-box domain-containing protein n=1 Tax=Asparagus officinalis TaxID=4686 RepID=A0A5P1EFF4_ASPOF|nr:F-box protein At3g07870-like [Asparagus officinalis]XP_020276680.1 F-box protein At3g07870-like [Asparagus officinalis]ONK64628.1 uncharacterized protein A4U43_C07F28150 [Asparagus officinalis]
MERFPRDIFFNIFSRLPLKSVIQSGYVSKSWLDMIKHPSFAKLYTSRSKPEPSILILTRRSIGEKKVISITPVGHKGIQLVADEISVDNMISSLSWGLVGTCNGLLCFASDETVTMVCNPVTRQHVTLPEPTIVESGGSYSPMLAFGFDRVTNKYKVVRVLYRKSSTTEAGEEFVRAEVYTLGTNSWREVQGFNHHHPRGKPVYANGVVYWLTSPLNGLDDRILSFDLGNEQFKLIPHRRYGSEISLTELGGLLSVVDLSSRDFIQIWVLKDATNIHWELEYNNPIRKSRWIDRDHPRLVCVHELRNVLVIWLQDVLMSYDRRSFLTRDLKVRGFPTWLDWEICSGYRGSLVPLENYRVDGENEQRDVVHFVSDTELHSILLKGGAFGEQKTDGRCDKIVACFQKHGLLL